MTELEQSATILRALAGVREQFLVLAQRLEREADVLEVTSDFDVRSYQNKTWIESFVEAKLTTGNFVVWWLDIREHEGEWLLEPVVFIQHSERQDDIARLPMTRVSNDNQFAFAVNKAVTALLAAPDQHLRVAVTWKGASSPS